MATRRRRLAPSIVSVTGTVQAGASGIAIAGNGFDAFGGKAYLYSGSDRTGTSDQLTIDSQTDFDLSVTVPGSLNNSAGTVYLFFQRRDLAWSQGVAVTLASATTVNAGADDYTIRDVQFIPADDDEVMRLVIRAFMEARAGLMARPAPGRGDFARDSRHQAPR